LIRLFKNRRLKMPKLDEDEFGDDDMGVEEGDDDIVGEEGDD